MRRIPEPAVPSSIRQSQDLLDAGSLYEPRGLAVPASGANPRTSSGAFHFRVPGPGCAEYQPRAPRPS
eukprot:8717869-Alexandrium_andersonii.AAC.1